MDFIQELMGGGQQKPTAQEMAGGIPQNADPGKTGLLGNGLLGMRGGNGLLGLRGKPGAGPQMTPPPVQQSAAPNLAAPPAQLMPQGQPIPPTAAPAAPMPMMGAAPPLQGNPQMLQALMARRQAMGQGAY
jgi:hypothetical protein